MISYETQWQKITEAYLNEQLNPYSDCACFIGNLLGGGLWAGARWINGSCSSTEISIHPRAKTCNSYTSESFRFISQQSNGMYSIQDICDLECRFLSLYNKGCSEDSLYTAMVSTLELLRQIHEGKGDSTAKPITLKKRELCGF